MIRGFNTWLPALLATGLMIKKKKSLHLYDRFKCKAIVRGDVQGCNVAVVSSDVAMSSHL